MKNLLLEAGVEPIGVPMDENGIDMYAAQRAFEGGAKVLVVTPSFQNPTGATMPAAHRTEICRLAHSAGVVVIENDMYSELACAAASALPRLKQLDSNIILLGSFSKIAFPGIRVGWIVAPRPVIARVTELKQLADLHTDHLSQAFLLRFAESGRLARHQARRRGGGKGKAARARSILPPLAPGVHVEGPGRRHEHVDPICRPASTP